MPTLSARTRIATLVSLATAVAVLPALLLSASQTPAQPPPAAGNRSRPVPTFRVDPAWPKPLPNRWIIGAVAGVAVDRRDHVLGAPSFVAGTAGPSGVE